MTAIAVVVLLHVGLLLALKSGLARKAVEFVTGPMEVDIVREEIIPPDEPPPPQVELEIPPPFVPAPEIAIDYPPEPVKTITTTTEPPPPVRMPPPRVVSPIQRTQPSVGGNGLSKPDYPPVSRRLGQEGTVTLRLYIQENGRVGEAQVEKTSGFPKLDDAAVRHSLRAWRFRPATENGKPIAVWHSFRVKFTLDDY
jgi:protein TonB